MKIYGNLLVGDKSQYPSVGAKSLGPGRDVMKSPKKSAGPEILNPAGVPTPNLKKKPG